MSGAVIAVADQVMLQDLRSRLDQSEIPLEVVFVAESTAELSRAVLSHQPSLIFVHDQLGPGLVTQTIRDLTMRNPALAVIMITATPSVAAYSAAMESGARGVLSYPFGLEDLENRLTSVVEWGQTVRRAVVARDSIGAGDGNRGRVLTVVGAKGGVGTTVVASHMAWDIATRERELRVCLVDLDVEKGDVPSYLDVSHRVSIADLAKISEDLSPRAVSDTIVEHTSGLHLLLAPTEIRDTDPVTAEAVRRIISQLRGLYNLVIIDAGAAVTTTQAAAVESADVTLQLVTADVPALRAARRQVTFWESLAVGNPDRTFVVVNRFERSSEIQQDTIDQLVLGRRSEILIPDLGRGLERAGNSRTPAEARNQSWWKSLRAISRELELVPGSATPARRERTRSKPSSGGRKKRRSAEA
ncbi:MAG: P-loop NTPase, partial [Microlunatus sp.]|nr:P-loop NTPase [Microlunatus sp.]